MNVKKYAIILALFSSISNALAQEEKVDYSKMSDFQLQEAYYVIIPKFIEDRYKYHKADYTLHKCEHNNPNNSDVCTELQEKFMDIYMDKSIDEEIEKIIAEKYRRKLYEGMNGRGGSDAVVGYERIKEGEADLYRQKKNLKDKNDHELIEKQEQINQELKTIYEEKDSKYFAINNNNKKLLAIQRELESRSKTH